MNAYLSKPFEKEMLYIMLKQFLDGSSVITEYNEENGRDVTGTYM